MHSVGNGEAAGAEALGRTLRAERDRLGIGVEAAARAIRVTPRVILAIEEGRVGDLPPQPYARGFIEAYAAWLGVEADGVPRAADAPAAAPGEGRGGFRPAAREGFRWRDWALPLALGAGLAAYVVARSVLSPAPEPLPAPAPSATLPGPETRPEPGDAQPAPGPGVEADDVDAKVRVRMRFEGETWVETAADGEPMQRHEMRPGDELAVTARERVTASLGDAGLTRIRVNERELGFVGQRGETRHGLLFVAPKPPDPARTGGGGDVRESEPAGD